MIRTLVIEDEEPAAARLVRLLGAVEPAIEVLDVIDSIETAVDWLQSHAHPDLIMLDIQLADGLSFDIFRKVRVDSHVIFTTAYDQYAIRAFELNSIDYLLKPVDRKKLAASLEKYNRLQPGKAPFDFDALLQAMQSRKSVYKQRFMVAVGARIIPVETASVAWFCSLEKNTFLCTREGRQYPVEYSLDRLEDLLDPEQFFRINRRYIVGFGSIEKISLLSRSRIRIEVTPVPPEDLLVSSARTHRFREWLDR